MRITVIELEEGDDPHDAIATALGRTNGTTVSRLALEAPRKKPAVVDAEIIDLPSAQAETWNYLVANDSYDGIAVGDMAEVFGIGTAAMGLRLAELINKGLAHKVRRGYYRAGEK